jgi:CubicO group peptidase (beta-lactamase class C family)
MLHHALLLSLLSIPAVLSLPSEECLILGPSFPSGFDITTTEAFLNATSNFPDQIEALFESGTLNRTHASFTIDVYSTATNASIYSYTHDASGLSEYLTAGVLNEGTIFRIGSVSKLYTVYAIIAHSGIEVFDHPVTQYLPELAGNTQSDGIVRENITVGSLASHQGGIGGFGKSSAA